MSDEDVNVIISLRKVFKNPLANMCESLPYNDEGCLHGHHVKANEMNDDMVDSEHIRLGHPLPCNVTMCCSKLRISQSASVR